MGNRMCQEYYAPLSLLRACGYSYEEEGTPSGTPTPSVSPSVKPDVPAKTGDSSVLLTAVAFIFAASLALALIVYPKRSER